MKHTPQNLPHRHPEIPADVIVRMQNHLEMSKFPVKGMPATLHDFYRRLRLAGLPPASVTPNIYAAVATSRIRLRTLLKALQMFAPDVPLAPAAEVKQKWDRWLNLKYNKKPKKPNKSRWIGQKPGDWPASWAKALPQLEFTTRFYGRQMRPLARKTRDSVIGAVAMLAESRLWAERQDVRVAETPSAELFEIYMRYLLVERKVSYRTAADYLDRVRIFFLRTDLLNGASLDALADLTGTLRDMARDAAPGKWSQLKDFRSRFSVADVLHKAIEAAELADTLPAHMTRVLRLRQKAVIYALLVNSGDRQGDLRNYRIGFDLIRHEDGNWSHAIRQSKSGTTKEISVLWPKTSALIDRHLLGDRPVWMIEQRVLELSGANLLTLSEQVLNDGFINLRLKEDFGIHAHLIRTLMTDLIRRERPDAQWAAQQMLGHRDRYMQETYRSDFAESGAVRAMDELLGTIEAVE